MRTVAVRPAAAGVPSVLVVSWDIRGGRTPAQSPHASGRGTPSCVTRRPASSAVTTSRQSPAGTGPAATVVPETVRAACVPVEASTRPPPPASPGSVLSTLPPARSAAHGTVAEKPSGRGGLSASCVETGPPAAAAGSGHVTVVSCTVTGASGTAMPSTRVSSAHTSTVVPLGRRTGSGPSPCGEVALPARTSVVTARPRGARSTAGRTGE